MNSVNTVCIHMLSFYRPTHIKQRGVQDGNQRRPVGLRVLCDA